MENSESLATLGTGWKQTKYKNATQKTKKMTPPKTGANIVAQEVKAVIASYKTLVNQYISLLYLATFCLVFIWNKYMYKCKTKR